MPYVIMDITDRFRDLLLDLRSRSEALPSPDRILKKRQRHVFSSRAEDILNDVNKLRTFLREDLGNARLSETEEDRVEAGALSLIRTTKALIGSYKKDLNVGAESDARTHFRGVHRVLERKLEEISELYAKQRDIRVQRGDINREMSKLFTGGTLPFSDSSASRDDNDCLEEELSPEEIQTFQRENAAMYEKLRKTQNEVQAVESKVVKIAELQELFTEKILQQKDDIDLISRNAVATTENIKDGNEEIRKAIQKKASIRVNVLFFLLIMSFSLLFLDWFNA